MKARYLVMLLPLLGASCPGPMTIATGISAYNYLNGLTVTQSDMDAALSAYDLAVAIPFATYRYSNSAHTVERRYCTNARPFTLTDPCAKVSVIRLIQPYVSKSNGYLDQVQACVNANPVNGCPGTTAAIGLFKSAWADAQGQITAQVAANKP